MKRTKTHRNLVETTTVVFLALAVTMLSFACSKSDSSSTPNNPNEPNPPAATMHHKYVSLSNMSFSPASLTISEGDTVTWTNKESTVHNVTSGTASGTTPNPDGKFSSSNLNKDDEFTVIFSASSGLGKGSYPYYCSFHLPNMKGSITVN